MRNLWYTKELKPYAQELRKNKNMTRQERMLWYHLLRKMPIIVKRQKIIGGYIADLLSTSYEALLAMRYIQYCSGVHPSALNCSSLGTMPALIIAFAAFAYRLLTSLR